MQQGNVVSNVGWRGKVFQLVNVSKVVVCTCMINCSKKCDLHLGFEVQGLYVIERLCDWFMFCPPGKGSKEASKEERIC